MASRMDALFDKSVHSIPKVVQSYEIRANKPYAELFLLMSLVGLRKIRYLCRADASVELMRLF